MQKNCGKAPGSDSRGGIARHWFFLTDQRVGTELIERLEGTPVLLVHGLNDGHIPWQSAQQVFRRAKDPKDMWIIPGGDHALTNHGDEIYDRLALFIAEVSNRSCHT